MEEKLNRLSATDRSSKFAISRREGYDTTSSQEKGLNESNFIKLSQIPEEEKIKIIQLGFQLQNEKKISSLENYYEGTETNSLFQLKGYTIKYESIRKNKFYKKLKPSTN